ncbi:hypothetical protein Tco_0037728 [Tanacetum coccineum]
MLILILTDKRGFQPERLTQCNEYLSRGSPASPTKITNLRAKIVITLNEQNTPHTEDVEGHPDLINTKGTQEQDVQNEHINSQSTKETLGNNTETMVLITEPLVPEVPQSQIVHHALAILHPTPKERWSRDQHIELVNIISEPTEGMFTRSMVAKLTAASASEYLFPDFLSEIEPKKVSEALKHQGWIDAMQEELN